MVDGNPDQVPAPIRNESVDQFLEEANLQADNQQPAPEVCSTFWLSASSVALRFDLFPLLSRCSKCRFLSFLVFDLRLHAVVVTRLSVCGVFRSPRLHMYRHRFLLCLSSWLSVGRPNCLLGIWHHFWLFRWVLGF